MSNKNLYRITESDVHIIMENAVKRILKEFYDQRNVAQLWAEALDMLGAETFVSILEDNWDMGDIYDKLIERTNMNEEDLDAITYEEMADLMGDCLDLEDQYEILKFVGEETGKFTVDDVTDAPAEVNVDIDSYDDAVDDEVSSEDEVEVEDDEEYEDPEFRGMNDLD